MRLVERIGYFPRAIFAKWLTRRIPASTTVSLSQRNIFIFPSRFGGAFLALALCLYVLGANYENNLIQLISFLMVSMMFTAIFFSFRNFSALTVEGLVPPAGQVGADVCFPVRLKVRQELYALQLGFPSCDLLETFQLEATGAVVTIPTVAKTRGWLIPGRLRLQSSYPMGLIRCWTYLDCLPPALIYPAPVKCTFRLIAGGQGENISTLQQSDRYGGDEFSHLKEYQLGESLSQVSWKHVAQGRGMVSKSFVTYEGEAVWLGFDSVARSSLENSLSHLAFAVHTLSNQGHVFGLILSGQIIGPDRGDEHNKECLRALALYGSVATNFDGKRK